VSNPLPRTPIHVADPAALQALVEALRPEPVLALDTESNSFHVYKERVCLIQLSTPSADYIVDPIAVDPRPLGEVLCDGRETVLHGADYDVRCLRREFGWRLPKLFDTMVAARRLGRPGLGLSALVEAKFGVRLSKAHQRSDWGRRPLTREQLVYASLDTQFLLAIAEEFKGELAEKKLVELAEQEFQRIAAAVPRERVFDTEGWRRLKGAGGLDPAGKKVLRALWLAREARAEQEDRPPFKVLGEPTMVEIAKVRPASRAALEKISGVTPQVLRRLGEAIDAALGEGATGTGAGGTPGPAAS
jgi:ribonuclease D